MIESKRIVYWPICVHLCSSVAKRLLSAQIPGCALPRHNPRFLLDVSRGGACIVPDMNIKASVSLLSSALLVLACGCVATADGHGTAGIPFLRDSFVDHYEKPVAQIDAATRVVLERNGKVLDYNVVFNSFKAKVNERNVWVRVVDLDGKVSQVTVQVRGLFGGDVVEAHELSKQIALQLMAAPNA